MTADDLMRLINRYVEACDDLGEGLFEKPLTTTDALHAKATALHGQILDEVYRLHALAAAQPPAAMPVPTGWICRHKQQVADAEKVFPGQPHDYLWKYTHGTRDMAECEGYGDFDVVRLYATPQAPSAPATGAQPWQPIETAPRDGRKIIVAYVNRNSKVRTVMARWMTDEQAAETDSDGVGLEGGWYECIDNWDDYTEVAIHEGEPEHWMPLPTAPTGSATPQGDSNG